MHSWPEPKIPEIEPSGSVFKFFDTKTRQIKTFEPLNAGQAKIYVCGITPYDATHLGHAMTYHSADLINRVLLDNGFKVDFSENITDIDDPLFDRALRDSVDYQQLAASQIDLFRRDMQALNIIPPTDFASVSESMPEIIKAANELETLGALYSLSNPDGSLDWYLDCQKYPGFAGITANAEVNEIFQERGGDPERAGKKNPLDPLVWRAQNTEKWSFEPAWDGQKLGKGRPGWHLECVVIAGKKGLPIDLQIGGEDLIFPHHEFSHSHAVALGAEDYSRSYLHVGMVGYQGAKMSKSLGNLVLVSNLIESSIDPRAIRLALLQHHYRSSWEYDTSVIKTAKTRLETYVKAASLTQLSPAKQGEIVNQLRASANNDLDTPQLLRIMDSWAFETEMNNAAGSQSHLVVDTFNRLTGVDLLK